jgi:hypothetical protein
MLMLDLTLAGFGNTFKPGVFSDSGKLKVKQASAVTYWRMFQDTWQLYM